MSTIIIQLPEEELFNIENYRIIEELEMEVDQDNIIITKSESKNVEKVETEDDEDEVVILKECKVVRDSNRNEKDDEAEILKDMDEILDFFRQDEAAKEVKEPENRIKHPKRKVNNSLISMEGKSFNSFQISPDRLDSSFGKRVKNSFLNLSDLVESTKKEAPFQCRICQTTFRHRESMKRHELIHTNDKKFSCDQCQRTFTRRDHMRNHMKTHAEKTHMRLRRSV